MSATITELSSQIASIESGFLVMNRETRRVDTVDWMAMRNADHGKFVVYIELRKELRQYLRRQ